MPGHIFLSLPTVHSGEVKRGGFAIIGATLSCRGAKILVLPGFKVSFLVKNNNISSPFLRTRNLIYIFTIKLSTHGVCIFDKCAILLCYIFSRKLLPLLLLRQNINGL